MGKNKRNKRQELDLDLPDDSDEGEAPSVTKSKFAALPPSGDEGSSGDEIAPAPAAKKKAQQKKMNAFALLGAGDDTTTSEDVSEKLAEMEIATEPAEAAVVDPFAEGSDEEEERKKKKKGGKKQAPAPAADGETGGAGTVKTKAQKAAEKKERERKKREQAKAKKNAEDDEFAAALAEAGVVVAEDYVEEKKGKKKKKKKKEEEVVQAEEDGEDTTPPLPPPTTTTEEAAPAVVEPTPEVVEEGAKEDGETPVAAAPVDGEEVEEGAGGKKKKKKKKKGAAAEPAEKKPSAMGRLLKERQELMKKQEEEFRRQQEEAEREAERKEEERLEKIRLEEERKQRKKEKERERKERKKKEGTWLTKAEKERRERDQAALEAMRQQGIIVPDKEPEGEKKPAGKVRYGVRQRKKKPQAKEEQIQEAMEDKSPSAAPVPPTTLAVSPDPTAESWELLDTPKVEDSVADNWDESEPEEGAVVAAPMSDPVIVDEGGKVGDEEDEEDEEDEDEDESEEDDEDDDEDEDDEDSGSSESDEEDMPVRERLEARKARAEKNKDPEVLRAPILCVLGHVDTGKTTILDKLRKTNVQEGEAGGITQQIGATNVPIDNIKRECAHLSLPELKIPGMLIIDTPGHESFSNLRSRGSSLCDMAILVVDIMHGLEQQTIESINLLKKRRTPFIVALNKIDRLYEWKIMNKTPVEEAIKKQKKITRDEFGDRSSQALLQFSEQGLNARLFYENPDMRTFINVVPVSGISGDGMADLLSLACELSQRMLGPQLIYRDVLEAMVLEVKAIHGLGTTVDIILKNGQIREADTVVLSGIEGAFSTTVRAVLTPHPMKEMRVKNNYVQHKVVRAAQGIKICARDMEKTLAGMPVYVAKHPDEVDVLVADANLALKEELKSIKVANEGVYVQASTLGSLEALLQFLKDSKIKYSGVSIGPVHKKDVMRASVMLQHDKEFACLLAFDVKVEREAQETADSLGVRIFTADIIYHLFDQFMGYKEELKARRKEENKHSAVFPCRLRILPTCIFNTRDPIVIGVTVINGVLRAGTPLCVPSKEFCYLGVCTSLEMNNKQIESAHTGQDVCIKIENLGTGDAPKLYGRHFDENDVLVSRITRDSIDTLKEYFRDEMSKEGWKLIVELKKIFEIL